ncbi:hypothetical protein GCM10027347_09040 [Larkinella harenae]
MILSECATWLVPASIVVVLGLLYLLYRSRLQRDRLNDQRKELETQLAQLQKDKQQQDELLSVISHDLRSPVASLKNEVVLLNAKNGQRDLLAPIERELSVLRLTLDNIIYKSLFHRNKLPYSSYSVQLGEVVDEVVEEFTVLINQKKLQIKSNRQPAARSIDENIMTLIVRNVFYHMIKMTPEQGTIFVNIQQQASRTDLIFTGSGQVSGGEVSLPAKPIPNPGLLFSEELMKFSNGKLQIKDQYSKFPTLTLSWG